MTTRIVVIALLGVLGCHAPTLWVGTALSPDTDAAHGDAGAAGRGGHIDEGVGGNVPPPDASTETDDDPQPSAAGGPADNVSAPDAGAGTRSDEKPSASLGKDDDAGLDQPSDPPEVLTPTKLPSIEGRCPDLNGPGTYTFTGGGRSLQVQISMRPDAKSKPAPGGPLIMYFHSLPEDESEVTQGVGEAAINEVIDRGGVVASFSGSTCFRCGLADDVAWYDEDDAVSDQVVACSIEKAQIDKRRIHAIGFSAGALHTMHLALARSNYIASVVSYSGGLPTGSLEVQDPTNKVAALVSFGREGLDSAVADFNIASSAWYTMFAPQGYYVLLCNHPRGHEINQDIVPHALQFLTDHPYQVSPEPYAPNIPAVFPAYCNNGPPPP